MRHRVHSAGMPRVTLRHAPNRKPRAAQRAVDADGLVGVRRARRIEAARRAEKRTEEITIARDQAEQQASFGRIQFACAARARASPSRSHSPLHDRLAAIVPVTSSPASRRRQNQLANNVRARGRRSPSRERARRAGTTRTCAGPLRAYLRDRQLLHRCPCVATSPGYFASSRATRDARMSFERGSSRLLSRAPCCRADFIFGRRGRSRLPPRGIVNLVAEARYRR